MGLFSRIFGKKDKYATRVETFNALAFLEVDMHNHLLPAIDDGAQSVEQSLQLIQGLNDLGLNHFISTPHIMHGVHNNNQSTIEHAHATLMEGLRREQNSSTIWCAAEHMVDDGLPQIIQQEQLMVMPGGFVLIEMSYLLESASIFHTIQDIQAKGLKVILAHPERYNYYHMNFERFKHLKDAGCYFQLNLLSLSRYYGIDVKSTALNLLKSGMYDFVGTDMHHEKHLLALRDVVAKYPVREMLKPCTILNASLLDEKSYRHNLITA